MIDVIFQEAALVDTQSLAQCGLSHDLNVWLQNYDKMEFISSTYQEDYTGNKATHFVYVSA